MSRDLTPVGPVDMLDRAITCARVGGAPVLVPSLVGGGLVAMVLLGLYYVERVEGIHTLRLPFAFALVLAFFGRALLLGRAARRVVTRLWDVELEPDAGRAVDVLRTSLVFGLGLWLWSWLLVLGSLGGPLGVALTLPFFALRGIFAPSWIARSACTAQGGLRAAIAAAEDNAGRRASNLVLEALVLLGIVGVAINFYASTAVGVLLARSFGGLEIAAVESFLSPSNTFVMLSVAAVTLVCFEPLRAAHSAVSYVDARVRADGLDLRASIDEAIRHSTGDRRATEQRVALDAGRAAVILLAALTSLGALAGGAPAARAQSPAELGPPPALVSSSPADAPAEALSQRDLDDARTRDLETQRGVEAILARSEFREFEDQRGAGLRRLVSRLFDWIFAPDLDAPTAPDGGVPRIPLPSPWVFLGLGLLLLCGVAIYLFSTHRREREAAVRAQSAAVISSDPRERAPSSFLDDAERLAKAGDLREALRALYLATLVALDRRRLIAFDPHVTNWQYLRQMPRNEVWTSFRQFTQLFDYKWYGHEATTEDDYDRCRTLAREIVGLEREAA